MYWSNTEYNNIIELKTNYDVHSPLCIVLTLIMRQDQLIIVYWLNTDDRITDSLFIVNHHIKETKLNVCEVLLSFQCKWTKNVCQVLFVKFSM